MLIVASVIEAENVETVSEVFKTNYSNQMIMDIEAALARAQASQGIIPEWAAKEITIKANTKYMPSNQVSKEYAVVKHRLSTGRSFLSYSCSLLSHTHSLPFLLSKPIFQRCHPALARTYPSKSEEQRQFDRAPLASCRWR